MPPTEQQLEALKVSERAVLGATFLGSDFAGRALSILTADDFGTPLHRAVFETVGRLSLAGKPVDVVTVGDEMQLAGWKIAHGDLVEMARDVPVLDTLPHYCRIVARHAALRRLAVLCADLPNTAEHDPEDAFRLLLEAQKLVGEIARGRVNPGIDVTVQLEQTTRELERREEIHRLGGAELLGLPTWIRGLDEITGGLRKGTLNVIGARTSVGKTALACQIAILGDVRKKTPCLFFTLEMSPGELAERFLARVAPVESHRLLRGSLDQKDWSRIFRAGQEMGTVGIFTISTTRTLSGILAESRAFRVMHPDAAVLIVVDYLQLVVLGRENKGRTREQEVSEVCHTLKGLSMELDAPILATAQVNRAPEHDERHPRLSDLRESGAIENDADLIVLAHRDRAQADGVMYLNVAKNRSGRVGEVDARWKGATYRIADEPEIDPMTGALL